MRKIFQARARLVVYVEAEAAGEMEKKARSDGKTLAEWTREALLGALGDNQGLHGMEKVPVVRRRSVHAGEHARALAEARRLEDLANPESDRPGREPGDCPHGIKRGWRCTLCGGVVK